MVSKKAARATEEVLAQVRAARRDPNTEAAKAVLARALAAPGNAVIAAAAQVVEEAQLTALVPALLAAFAVLMDPPQSDPNCKGKTAIVRALLALDADATQVYLAGVRHFQREPIYGGSVDTAAELRGMSALALLRARHSQGALLVAECLADVEAVTRSAAARALSELDPAGALPLLRYKLAIGDENPEVIGACLGSVLDHDAELGLKLGAQLLASPTPEAAEAVALALGESRKPGAFALLRDFAADAGPSGRAVAFVAMTLLREEQATAHLVEVVAKGRKDHAAEAVRALGNFRHDPRLKAQVEHAARQRGDPALLAQAQKSFGAG